MPAVPVLHQKRVAKALLTDGAGGTVTADEGEIVAEWKELGLDRLHEGVVTGLRQSLGAADRAPEQHVADQGEALGCVDIRNGARRMAWTMQDGEGCTCDGNHIALGEPTVRRHVEGTRHAEGEPGRSEIVEQEL